MPDTELGTPRCTRSEPLGALIAVFKKTIHSKHASGISGCNGTFAPDLPPDSGLGHRFRCFGGGECGVSGMGL